MTRTENPTWVYVLILIICVGALRLIPQAPPVVAADNTFLYPPGTLKHFSLGYQNTMADSLWVRVIQDLTVCDQLAADADLTPYYVKHDTTLDSILTDAERRKSRCSQGWVYHMISAIVDLSPQFRSAYSVGAIMLSVLVDDKKGASDIFDRGMKVFPKDWILAYRAAYHELFEMGNLQKAASLLKIAGENGAPKWVFQLAARLYEKDGQVYLGLSVLQDALKTAQDPAHKAKIESRIAELKSKLERTPAKSQ